MGKQVYYAVVQKDGKVAYGYQNINAECGIPVGLPYLTGFALSMDNED